MSFTASGAGSALLIILIITISAIINLLSVGVCARRPSVGADEDGDDLVFLDANRSSTLGAVLDRLGQLENLTLQQQTTISSQQSTIVGLTSALSQLQQSVGNLSGAVASTSANVEHLCSAVDTPQFVFVQGIPTHGANGIIYFSMNGEDYLVVGNYHNGTTYVVNSQIFKKPNGSDFFFEFQSVPFSGDS